MAIKIDNELLQELGLGGLPEQEKQGLLSHIYETLEMRVGVRLADQMSNEQLEEFEKYFDAKDDNGAFDWLKTNFPNYKDIVQEEFDKLKQEVAQSAPQILQAAQTNPAVAALTNPPQANANMQQPGQASSPTPPPPVTPYQEPGVSNGPVDPTQAQ